MVAEITGPETDKKAEISTRKYKRLRGDGSAEGERDKGKKKDRPEPSEKRKEKEAEGEEAENEEEGDRSDEEEEGIKYSIAMWAAIVLLFLGVLMVVLGLWLSSNTFLGVGILFLGLGAPLFVFEYRKMEAEGRRSVRRSALLLLRDVGVAFLIVGIIMAAIVAYSQVWPPMVVIESDSMQHSDSESFVGTIDTGDLVLVKKAPNKADVTTYIEGRTDGHYTYGDYGDVIVYRRCGASVESTPIIHRAMAYLVWNETTNSSYDVPALENLELGKDWYGLQADGSTVTSPYNISGSIFLYDVGYTDANFSIYVSSYIGLAEKYNTTSFFLTAGDHNLARGSPKPDPFQPCNGIVKQDWIIGVARGEIPWFGLIKLTLNPGTSGCCRGGWGDTTAPRNSWDSLLISLVLIITIPFVLDFAIGFVRERRRKRRSGTKKGGSKKKSETKDGKGETESKDDESEKEKRAG